MDDYWQVDDERVWRQRGTEKQKPLSVTLKKYSLYLAYLALFLAFTENLQMMSEAESYTPPPPPLVYARRMPRYAAAG
ncbi:hypothetical protein L5515_013802 [Caenorhabditis briggsae]|uniref:Uncharacterized protein n=1 Tax=Caenorhabditis briggsae TaxID=6238 RepID=A0AAE9DJ69_CAEBR|nr:hypothetical protein L3Y34_017664 [Caenorhabditis briggsae]UMM17069.1 hypothetical protein L5515_013802 [Caenorhabditis briggsae]